MVQFCNIFIRYFHTENSGVPDGHTYDYIHDTSSDYSPRPPYPGFGQFPDSMMPSQQRFSLPQFQPSMGRFQYPQQPNPPPFYPMPSNSLIRAQPPMQQQMSYGQGNQTSYLLNNMYSNARGRPFTKKTPRPHNPVTSRAPRLQPPRQSPPSFPITQQLNSQQPVTVSDPYYTLDPLGSGAYLYRCTLCSINCNSLQMWESHVSGRKHTHQVKLFKGLRSPQA